MLLNILLSKPFLNMTDVIGDKIRRGANAHLSSFYTFKSLRAVLSLIDNFMIPLWDWGQLKYIIQPGTHFIF